jgi:hypothetical protein
MAAAAVKREGKNRFIHSLFAAFRTAFTEKTDLHNQRMAKDHAEGGGRF